MNSRLKMPSASGRALYFALFAVGVILLFLRNPHPVFNPIVYAEDGVWTALALREGWLDAFLFSREDYFVFLNTLLLLVSLLIAMAVGGGTIEALPYSIAAVSYSFFSMFAIFVFATVKSVSSSKTGLFAFLLVLLIPLGATQNEIIGRILQIGFFVPALSVMLFFWRDKFESRYKRGAIDVAIFISAGTNPVVFVLAFFYLSYRLYCEQFALRRFLHSNALLIALLSLLAITILPRMVGGGSGGIPVGFAAENLVEAVFARSILYPLVFPWYSKLSDSVALVLFAVFATFVFVSIRCAVTHDSRKLIYLLIGSVVVYTALTMVMRSGLTVFLNDYQATFPDRYFMGINVLISILIAVCLAQLLSNEKARVVGILLFALVASVYVFKGGRIFEWERSRMPIGDSATFHDQICFSQTSSGMADIQIYPVLPNWKMLIPQRYIEKTHCVLAAEQEVGLDGPAATNEMVATAPLTMQSSLQLNLHQISDKDELAAIEVLFGTHMRDNPGDAALVFETSDGKRVDLEFSLSDLQDNTYKRFSVPEGSYLPAEVESLTGSGVSVWEVRSETGEVFSCINFLRSDGELVHTPGCPVH